MVNPVRDARRLATDVTSAVPSLNIAVTVLCLLFGGVFDPRGVVRLELGRNVMEEGKARRLLWEGTFDLPPSPPGMRWVEVHLQRLSEQ